MKKCTHADQIKVVAPSEGVEGCEDCLKTGDWWVHLRICLTCGHIGCCDQSPNRHARQHFGESDHPIIQSVEPGEKWAYCFVDELIMREPPSLQP